MRTDTAAIAKNTGILFVSRVVFYVLSLLFIALMARIYGAEAYGAYVYVYSAISILEVIIQLGTKNALVFELPRAGSNGHAVEGRSIAAAAVVVTGGLAIVLTAVALLLADPISAILLGRADHQARFRLLAFVLLSEPLVQVIGAVLRGNSETTHFALGDSIRATLRFMILIPVWLLSVTEYAIEICYLGASTLTLVYYGVVLWRKGFLGRISALGLRRFGEISLHFIPSLFVGILSVIQNKAGRLFLGNMLSASAAGIFSIVVAVANLSSFLYVSMSAAISPMISKLHSEKDLQAMSWLYKTTTRWVSAANLLFLALVVVLRREILQVFGAPFRDGVTALVLVCIGQVVNSGTGACAAVINMTGRNRVSLLFFGISAGVNLMLNVLLVPSLHINGAALASMVSMILTNALGASYVRWRLKLHPFSWALGKQVLIVAGAFGVGLLVNAAVTGHWLYSLIVVSSAVIGVFVGLNLLVGLEPDDREVLKRIARRLKAVRRVGTEK